MEKTGDDWVHVVAVIDAMFLRPVGIAPCHLDDPAPVPPIPPTVRGPWMPTLTAKDERRLAETGVLWESELHVQMLGYNGGKGEGQGGETCAEGP